MELRHSRIETPLDGVRVLRLDRKPVNALSSALLADVQEAFTTFEKDESVKVIIVYGGPMHFSAGADVDGFTPRVAETGRRVSNEFRAALDTVANSRCPTIAAICGYALGGGLELALACDFRFGAQSSRIGFPEIQLGIIPGGGGTARLARLVGPAKAKHMIFTGRHIPGEEAYALGIFDRLLSADEIFPAALSYATELSCGAVAAMTQAKRSIDGGIGLEMGAALSLETECFAQVFTTQDADTGIRSFLENGPGKAVFEGR